METANNYSTQNFSSFDEGEAVIVARIDREGRERESVTIPWDELEGLASWALRRSKERDA